MGTTSYIDDATTTTSFEMLKGANKEPLPRNFTEPVSYGEIGFFSAFKSRYVFLCALFASLGGLLFGYDQGVISIILVMRQFTSRISELDKGGGFFTGFMTAMIELGAAIGAFNVGWVADKYSRKGAILIATVWFIIGSVIQTAAMDYAMIVVGRFIGGIGIGMYSSAAPLYIGEISAPHLRGSLLALEQLSIVFGICVAYWITYGTKDISDEWSWRLPFLLQIIPGVFLGIGAFILPFSPRWLALKGRNDDSLKSLCKLRQLPASHPMVQQEWLEIRAEVVFQLEVQHERHPHLFDKPTFGRSLKLEYAQWLDLFKKRYIRRTLVGVLIMFFQQFTGINGLIYYSPTLFEALGFKYDMQLILGGVMNIAQLLGVIMTFFIIDKAGRRPIYLSGTFVCLVAMVIVGSLSAKFADSWNVNQSKAYAAMSFIFVYMIAFGASQGTLGWVMPSEVFSVSLRAKGVAASTVTNWVSNFVVGLVTPMLMDRAAYAAYLFFGIFCLLCLVWAFKYLPETRGLTLEEIDRSFKDNQGQTDEKRKAEILADVRREVGVTYVED